MGDYFDMIESEGQKTNPVVKSPALKDLLCTPFPKKDTKERTLLAKEDYCPECGGDLNTFWECNKCGYDAQLEARTMKGSA